ncbi:MAG: hypothetical protein K6T33_04595 [Thermomonas hydrothermalis]|uniref:hypothetical protein n=1 Tax=Thermomonas hydrothermalis TaxID=213588 RepID=UPI00235674BE|nr:hypothetical protein [Thermomonas hydrothermalis]MCL6619049.1 hypothetical protein [Thermomonas hydrothermalis]
MTVHRKGEAVMQTPVRHSGCIVLAVALSMLAMSAVAADNDKKSTRGYVVGDGGVARMAETPQSGTDSGQSTPTDGARLTIKTKSSPPVHGGAPIGVNEPGVNLRGIEKKDIRRGMVIPPPSSTTRAGQTDGSAEGSNATGATHDHHDAKPAAAGADTPSA